MLKNVLVAIVILISLATISYVAVNTLRDMHQAGMKTETIIGPFLQTTEEEVKPEITYPLGKPINILLLGIDRRSRTETSYRTDIMILLSVNPETNRVVLVSLPRDLWYGGGRLNAIYISEGWEGIQQAVGQITGQKPERFILTDFKDFSWIVDAMGGIAVDIDTTFTDTQYPVDETYEYQTVSFVQGTEKLTGERALIFSRSRKGSNGEGSDWMRMKRQHKMLKGMVEAIQQPGSIFRPMVVEEAFKMVTQNKMDTNLTLYDSKYLWDFYKDRDLYTFHSLYLDSNYVYNPPMEDYGGAWVLAPINGTYATFQAEMYNQIYNIDMNNEQPTGINSNQSGTEM